ncbi:MAG: Holliday junction resolvase RuvX [Pseudomonadota bacterium]
MSSERTAHFRLLAFDFGTQFIGVCYGHTYLDQWKILKSVRAKDGIPQWHDIRRLIDDYQPQQLLIGLPLHMDGNENQSCVRARKFANRLHERFKLPIEMVDERLTSDDAEALNMQGDIHGRSALLILQRWLSAHAAPRE